MDVPFISSGAISRAHYALVRKVEAATSPQLADQYLLAEVKSVRYRLAQPGLSLQSCRECLLILLYCSMAITSGLLAHGELDFALPQAVSLAEAGNTTSDKRIGYLFCADIMPQSHELQLMLVNTLRKDLENSSIPRICLALDTLIHSSTEDVIPAVQSRLHDLLSHNSYHVRRRALLAFRTLSAHDPELVKRIIPKVQKRLKDSESSVVGAALLVSADVSSTSNDIKDTVNNCLTLAWEAQPERTKLWFLLKVTLILRVVKVSVENLSLVLDILKYTSDPPVPALLYGSFRLLSDFSSETIAAHQRSSHHGPVHHIRHLLTSTDPNVQYLFLACLQCVKPDLWAGTHPDRPAVLEGWEVERVMKYLDSPDRLIRKKTLDILHQVDPGIASSYLAQSLKGNPSALAIKEKNEYTIRLLEVVEVQCGEDGELYARQLREVFAVVDQIASPERHPVLENVVEMVLLYIKEAGTGFKIGCAATLIAPAIEGKLPFSSTLMVIVSAMASEYTGRLSIPPADILQGLASRLTSYSASVQDACLLSMLRVAADCDEVPPEVLILVKELAQHSSKHIRKRCDQFIMLCGQRNLLVEVVSRARSPTLPDFLEALTIHTSPQPSHEPLPISPPGSPNQSSSQASLSTSKLRYDAYERPPVVPRHRRPSISQRSYSGSSRSNTHSDNGERLSSRLSTDSEEGLSLDELSKTVTAGDLALAARDIKLEMMSNQQPKDTVRPSSSHNVPAEDLTSRVDLIAFDSPFISDPPDRQSTETEPDFEGTWNASPNSSARGWCELSIDVVVRRLQGLRHSLQVIAADLPPFEGDFKILISSGSDVAALRLQESDDESCLWRLRCSDTELRTSIKRSLE